MTKLTMITLFASTLLMGGVSARAADIAVPVPVSGRSTAQVKHAVEDAAYKVCARALREDILGEYGTLEDCEAATIAVAMKQLNAAPADSRFAQAEPSPAH